MRIMIKADVNPKEIRKIDSSHYIYTNIYLDKNKKFPLIEIDTDKSDVLHGLGITRFICVSGNWACETQSGEGNFYHEFLGVKYHRNFDEEPIKNGYLDLYVQDRKLYI